MPRTDPAPGLPPISAGLKAVLLVARSSADLTDRDPRHDGPAPNWMHWASGFELGCELARQDPALTARLVDELTLWRNKVPGALTKANKLREQVAGQIRDAARMD